MPEEHEPLAEGVPTEPEARPRLDRDRGTSSPAREDPEALGNQWRTLLLIALTFLLLLRAKCLLLPPSPFRIPLFFLCGDQRPSVPRAYLVSGAALIR